MKKYLIILIFLIPSMFAFTQTVEEMEYDLSWYKSSEKYGDKIAVAWQLLELDPFNYTATRYVCSYYRDRQIDSISIFFENIIAQHPNNVESYLLVADLLSFENNQRDVQIKKQINYLNRAFQIDRNDKEVIYNLAKVYYKDFIYPRETWKLLDTPPYLITMEEEGGDTIYDIGLRNRKGEKSTFAHSADSALFYFYKLWDTKKSLNELIYFSIRQLECFLGKKESPITENILSNTDYCYFPPWYFANLEENWECDTTVDYLFEIYFARPNWITNQLIHLNEPCLYNRNISDDKIVYRFTWLRTFHNPIAIRIEKINTDIFIYWKVGKGMGGYEPRGIKKSGKRKIKEEDWNIFISLVEKADFDNLPNNTYIPMTDGASWTLEQKTSTTFKAHKTNLGSSDFQKCCLYLLNLAKIKVKEEDIY